jgi:hypothetical protein
MFKTVKESDWLKARELKVKPVETVECNYNSKGLALVHRNLVQE